MRAGAGTVHVAASCIGSGPTLCSTFTIASATKNRPGVQLPWDSQEKFLT